MIEAAAKLGDKLLVIVNNDVQQVQKKDKIILDQTNRLRLIRALRVVDEAVLSIDQDPPVINTLEMVAREHPDCEIIFANGGDRASTKVVPETDVCSEYGIEMVFGVGGTDKADSSTRINQALGHAK